MPVVIQEMTSQVTVSEGAGLSNEVLEQIIKLVLERLRAEMQVEALTRRSSQIRSRMSDTGPYRRD